VRKEKKNSFCEYTNIIIEDEERRKRIYIINSPLYFFVLFFGEGGVLSQPQEQRREQKKGTIGYISHFRPHHRERARVPALENRVYERKPSKTTTQSHKTDSNAFKSAQSDFAANLFPHRSEGRLTRDFFLAAKGNTHT